jgi:hypothetical protein
VDEQAFRVALSSPQARAGFFALSLVGAKSLDRVDRKRARFSPGVERKAARRPVLGMNRQSPLDRIQMHVLELLDPFLVAPDVEIMEAELPETRQGAIEAKLQRRGRPAADR